MTTLEGHGIARVSGARRAQLRYGFNEVDAWWYFALGEDREQIHRRLRLMGTDVVRLFVFDKPVPDPVKAWHLFAACVQAVLDVGARPMVTFAKYPSPYDDPRNLRTFVARCADLVWGCIEQWGGEKVRDWYWCVWNEPNNPVVGGDLKFALYRRIYEEVAAAVLQVLEPHLGGQKARIGGPAVDGTHRSFWMDWIARLVTEVDARMVGFVSWHRYGDWRPAVPGATIGVEMNGTPDLPTDTACEALLMAQTSAYEARARGVARLLQGRDILNVCGELNTIAHHEDRYTRGLNQNAFGAAYYASALIHLLRGGADLEMRWTATARVESYDAYGLMSRTGDPTPACLAKQLFARHVRYGDWVRFPAHRPDAPHLDAVAVWGEHGRRSTVFVNTARAAQTIDALEWDGDLSPCDTILRLDTETNGRLKREPFNGTIRMNGYGIAVVTNVADAELE